MKNRSQLVVNTFFASIIICMSMCSCTNSVTEQEQDQAIKNAELREIEEYEFTQLFMELKNTINEIDYKLGKVCDFSWESELGSVGRVKDDKHGITRFTSEIEIINSELASDYDTLSDKLSGTRNSISDVWNQRPYREPQSVIEEMEMQTIDDWKFDCSNMALKIKGMREALINCKNNATKVFDIELYNMKYNVKSGQLDDYVEILSNDIDKYHELVDETMSDLNKACEFADELQEWKFSALVKDKTD